MKYAVCNLSVIPIRKSASEKSEMISQLLFGEYCRILDEINDWVHIQTSFDGYEGWCSRNQLDKVDEKAFQESESTQMVIADKTAIIGQSNGIQKIISYGSSLHADIFAGKTDSYLVTGNHRNRLERSTHEQLIQDAKLFLSVPYLWGGRSVFGLDCSGFMQLIFKVNGLNIPRDSHLQSQVGKTIHFLEEAQPGDLLFFDNEEGRIIHVGLLIDRKNVIHASGYVRIDPVDHYGIFNTHLGKYSHKLRVIKRLKL